MAKIVSNLCAMIVPNQPILGSVTSTYRALCPNELYHSLGRLTYTGHAYFNLLINKGHLIHLVFFKKKAIKVEREKKGENQEFKYLDFEIHTTTKAKKFKFNSADQ